MLSGYWEKARKVGEAVRVLGTKSVRKIAQATNISKSAAARHLKASARRNQHPESILWESSMGQLWLMRLVSATIFHFGIQRGVGAETISHFFKDLRIDTHVAISPTAIRSQRLSIEQLIVQYSDKYQQEGISNCHILEIIGGVDETFFKEMMILLAMDLPTGYILSEKSAKNRKYDTWKEQLKDAFSKMPIKVRYLVSDRAPALIKLATEHFECKSIADLFHATHKIAQTFSLPLHNKVSACRKELEKIEKEIAKLPVNQELDAEGQRLEEQKIETKSALSILKEAQQQYLGSLHQFSLVVHPFQIEMTPKQESIPAKESTPPVKVPQESIPAKESTRPVKVPQENKSLLTSLSSQAAKMAQESTTAQVAQENTSYLTSLSRRPAQLAHTTAQMAQESYAAQVAQESITAQMVPESYAAQLAQESTSLLMSASRKPAQVVRSSTSVKMEQKSRPAEVARESTSLLMTTSSAPAKVVRSSTAVKTVQESAPTKVGQSRECVLIGQSNVYVSIPQSSEGVEKQLRQIVKNLQALASKHELNYQKKLKSVKNQLPDLASLMDLWWEWVNNSLTELVSDPIIQRWAKSKLLPKVYWQKQIGKSANKEINKVYQETYQKVLSNLELDPLTATIEPNVRSELDKWAKLMVQRFCRTSSAVEGRNGTLSQLNHCRRGFKGGQLPVLTVLHNFHIRRADGTTAAERFFNQEFPDLFEWFLPQIESLPRPRASRLHRAV